MTWPPRWKESHFKHTSVVPQKLVRHWKKAEQAGALAKCYKAVDLRDGFVCAVTGKALKADHPDPALRLTRDHLGARSTHPADRAKPDNVATVSQLVHEYTQASALYPIDKHGEETTRVSRIVAWRWNEAYFTDRLRKSKPFRLPPDRDVKAERFRRAVKP